MQKLLNSRTNRGGFSTSGTKLALALIASALTFGAVSRADMVTDWNATLSAAINATPTDLPPVAGRKAPQSNDVTLDDRGLIYLVDRWVGFDILEFKRRAD